MIPRLDGVLETCLYVDDMERSRRFYQSVLGFETVDSGDRLIAMKVTNRQLLLLFKRGASARLASTPHDGNGHLHLAFAIPAVALESWKDWLTQHDVAIEEEHKWERGGTSLYFRDPDQHVIEVATPGVWSIY